MRTLFLDNLSGFLQQKWLQSGFTEATMIQNRAIPPALNGQDVIAESPTGTGKTIAYLLPLLDKINPEISGMQAIILAPSQELVIQIFTEIQKWSKDSGIRAASFIGGANKKRQLDKLKKHPHIAVGTPGRMLELIKEKKLKMHEVKLIVLDEGDQLLGSEHIQVVKTIVHSALRDRQILLFSATISQETEILAKQLTNQAVVVKITDDHTIKKDTVNHIYFLSEQRDKIKILEKISRISDSRSLVFIRDIGNLQVLMQKLEFKKISAGMLHSDANKMERKRALRDFRSGKLKLLLATDLAARGLDIKDITHVVHYDFPKDVTQYIHRSGRCGRFGAKGTVISIVTEREERSLKKYCGSSNIPVAKKQFYRGEIVSVR
ncbi:DEAD/DEAH box helicase [Bacillaceae bacterium Marseille-Q3522]|nr:DEAD/DEAH box helicase [Bacillaceae bacterium Marseille-Q3522]